MIRAIVIKGDFDESDFAELVALLRTIDDRHPEREFAIVAVDPDRSALESADIVQAALPPREGRETSPAFILRHRKPH